MSVQNNMERHWQTGLIMLIVALIAWFGTTVHSNSIKLAELHTSVKVLIDQKSEMTIEDNVTTRRLAAIEQDLAGMKAELEAIRRELQDE